MKRTALLIILGLLIVLGTVRARIDLRPEEGRDVSDIVSFRNSKDVRPERAPIREGRTGTRAGVDPGSPARLEVNKSVTTEEIWKRGDGRTPRNTTVELTVRGVGDPSVNFNSQDVVFTIDCSDSMDKVDPTYLRREAAKEYVGQLIEPDRATVVRFSDRASLINDRHLTSDYQRIVEDLNYLDNGGQTNFTAAMELTNRELTEHGTEENVRICILLTDGKPEPRSTNITPELLNETMDNNITVFTVGLYHEGSSALLDEDLLRWLANETGGAYYKASRPEDLLQVYDSIAMRFRNYTAGYDNDITDDKPMIRDVIGPWFDYDNDSFSTYPDSIYTDGNDLTFLEWNVSRMMIGEEIAITYNVSSASHGRVQLDPQGYSRVYYQLDGEDRTRPFPTVYIYVLSSLGLGYAPPPPPPPALPPPPPPPPGGYPVPVVTPAAPTVVPLSAPAGLPAAASPGILPVEYVLAGFVGLGILERLRLKKRILAKQKVTVGT